MRLGVRIPRRLVLALLAAVAIGSLVVPTTAIAATRERLAYSLQFDGDIDCGTFHDVFIDYYDVVETDVYDAAGDLVSVILHAAHRSDDRNSVTGLVLHEHGHLTEVHDLIAETITITGASEVINVPGQGVLVQDTGRFVFTFDGDLTFFAGGRKHSEIIIGDAVLCDALS